jgi:eukaryotic-like serine/threonine-protein kinase
MLGKLKPGTVLAARYRIVDTLGSGGTATVYLAEDMKLPGKSWAIKELSLEQLYFDDGRREAQLLIALEHPHLPKIIDYLASDGTRPGLLVMEYIRGRTLQQLFEQQNSRLAPAKLLKYMLQLTDALEYLHHQHHQPIVHRDIKPSNVMINEYDEVKLIDFGTARRHKQGHTDDTVKLGTIGFASPEQFRQEQTEPRSDLYSLGAMMYYLLSGGRYYYTEKSPILQVAPDVDREWARLIDKLLSHHPADRYDSAAQVKRELERIRDRLQRRTGSPRTALQFVPGKLIVVGSVYSGAGATFSTILLARALHRYGVPHAVSEIPGGQPDLYYSLNGESSSPSPYTFCLERSPDPETGAFPPSFKEWTNGGSVWLPLPPHPHTSEWNAAFLLQRIRSAKQPVILIDISNRWEEPEVKELCKQADHLVVVYGADLIRCKRPSSSRILQLVTDWSEAGKEISYVCNMSARWKGRAEWLDSLPSRPIVEIPNIPYEEVLSAAWKGALLQDDSGLKLGLLESMEPLVLRLFPELAASKKRGIRGFASIFLRRDLSRW